MGCGGTLNEMESRKVGRLGLGLGLRYGGLGL